MSEKTAFTGWAIVEVMGHHTYAGQVSEQTVGGTAFVRVDVPELSSVDGQVVPAFSKLFNASAIYAITPVSEMVARLRAHSLRASPVSVWDLPEAVREKLRARPALEHLPGDPRDDEEDYGDGDDI